MRLKVEKEFLQNIGFDWDLIEFRTILKFADFNRTKFLMKKDMPVSVLMSIVSTDSILRYYEKVMKRARNNPAYVRMGNT